MKIDTQELDRLLRMQTSGSVTVTMARAIGSLFIVLLESRSMDAIIPNIGTKWMAGTVHVVYGKVSWCHSTPISLVTIEEGLSIYMSLVARLEPSHDQ